MARHDAPLNACGTPKGAPIGQPDPAFPATPAVVSMAADTVNTYNKGGIVCGDATSAWATRCANSIGDPELTDP